MLIWREVSTCDPARCGKNLTWILEFHTNFIWVLLWLTWMHSQCAPWRIRLSFAFLMCMTQWPWPPPQSPPSTGTMTTVYWDYKHNNKVDHFPDVDTSQLKDNGQPTRNFDNPQAFLFLSWVVKTQLNHYTKRVVRTWLTSSSSSSQPRRIQVTIPDYVQTG